ncbi:hypothetical protein PHYBLDRAFT_138042 [Phycomyces blakesleeanus NRRL 1555(-)]|uniref:DIS3-like exonuclease 1 n=1 Tax=Phycomyces blakesleeanus (strain ATCC 8743b / DSM 1359 / FGSC 10004 / NBRC 33097 / NRRL 1555) TaxID=763407 RepID=A0A167QYT3_PHYB8|nr:hypothetical protein PHYBLDRAFT_138042 [Phycomyces blakesleeanus NRRL 1555(-)]OAD80484.1 hypothetical protein PHYBLDRAFT_138042 [Phycomyces blakesleeanus NRRL 1555(-)]|eukprot:XP_018298524.1 hypothetical protein PHYBLDRAFT_138042 [Phycomyces blakesleeanus NRRL 1555(-)]
MRYLEILEQEEMTGIILSQTIVTSLQQHDKSRTYRKLRHIINDSRRKSVIFYNEVFADTQTPRLPGEPAGERDWRALRKLADWYYHHLGQKKRIILLSEIHPQQESNDVCVYSMQAYLNAYWPTVSLLQNLVHALANVELEDDMERIRMTSSKKRGNTGTAVQGFTEYKSTEELEVGIKSSRFFSGTLRCRSDARDQAYVNSAGKDILIVGNQNRNRAVHGDTVVVELLSENNWATASNEISYEGGSTEEDIEGSQWVVQQTEKSRPTGRVVGILNRNWRSYVATLQEDSPDGSFHLAVPLDSVIPKIRIRHQEAKLIQNQRIVVRIDHWPVSSQYPQGHYVRSLGPIHHLDTEISAILVEHGISVSQATQGFSEASLKEMPIDTPEMPWRPEQDEIKRRKDLRSLTVFSIDPPNCQDIDDALSIRELKNGNIELGVHIADVSYFVKEHSLTDLEARARGTTVYLADRRFDMLPSVLSERVCSLRENVDRYSVSVLWTLDKSYKVLDVWFGRTIIRSSCEMEYEQAQKMLDGESTPAGVDPALSRKLKPFVEKLAQVLHSMEIHGLVAEAMIMANSYVGKRAYQGYKDAALLRRHPPPSATQFDRLIKAAKSQGFSIDFSSNRSLARSLEIITRGCQNNPEITRMLKTMATMAMNEAGYVSSGQFAVSDYYHYGLALEYYTHFTSPIRRYADVVAHRQLLMCVGDSVAVNDANVRGTVMTQDSKIAEICMNLNLKSRESKLAQRDSTELFQSLYVLQHTMTGPLIESGIISEIRSNGFYVFLPRFGLKGPVFLIEKDGSPIVPLSLVSNKAKEEDYIPNSHIEVSLPTNVSVTSADLPHPINFQLFDHVRVSLKLRKSHAHRHMVYMTLVGLEHTTKLGSSQVDAVTTAQLSRDTMMRSIAEQEEAKAQANAYKDRSKEELETRKQMRKAAKNNGSSIYQLLEPFRKMSIIESTTSQ